MEDLSLTPLMSRSTGEATHSLLRQAGPDFLTGPVRNMSPYGCF
jgi:hypothetical protein